jgi:hypothetical protein
MQDQAVLQGQFLGVENGLVGIVDKRIAGNAPGLVTNHSGTVLTRGFGVISVAMKNRIVQKHGTPGQDSALRTAPSASRFPLLTVTLTQVKADSSIQYHKWM